MLSVALAGHVGNQTAIDATCAAAPERRIAVQVGADGSLPLEDSRTKSEAYHAYDATALLTLAEVCLRRSSARTDLFSYTSSDDGRGLARAMAWLAPFTARLQPWPFQQVVPFDDSTVGGGLPPRRLGRPVGGQRHRFPGDGRHAAGRQLFDLQSCAADHRPRPLTAGCLLRD